MYDISGRIPIEHQITKVVFRERLVQTLKSLSADVDLSNEDGAVEFKPALRNRGKHPLKNITMGRISLFTNETDRLYVNHVRYQLSLVQMRISLVIICLGMWLYSLLRGYGIMLPLALTILTWIFGYAIAMVTIRSRFREMIDSLLVA